MRSRACAPVPEAKIAKTRARTKKILATKFLLMDVFCLLPFSLNISTSSVFHSAIPLSIAFPHSDFDIRSWAFGVGRSLILFSVLCSLILFSVLCSLTSDLWSSTVSSTPQHLSLFSARSLLPLQPHERIRSPDLGCR